MRKVCRSDAAPEAQAMREISRRHRQGRNNRIGGSNTLYGTNEGLHKRNRRKRLVVLNNGVVNGDA